MYKEDNVSSELVWILKEKKWLLPREEMDNLSQFQSVFNPTTLIEFLLKLGKSKFTIYYFEYSLLLPIYCFDGQLIIPLKNSWLIKVTL